MSNIPSTLRRLVHERAGGQCEYCMMPETDTFALHEIDHVISQKHGGGTEAENLALCCTFCNKYKGTDIASLDSITGQIVPFFHPRKQRWHDHFRLEDASIVPLTPVGRVTVRLLQLNHPDRIEERRILLDAGVFHLRA